MAQDEATIFAIEREFQRQRARLLAYFVELGRPDIAEELTARFRDIDLGIAGAQGTWHALSPAQRRVLQKMGEGMYLRRAPGSRTRYDAIGTHPDQDSDFNLCALPTLRNLSSRELISVAGGAFDPEAKFVLTERGSFVLQHGEVHQ